MPRTWTLYVIQTDKNLLKSEKNKYLNELNDIKAVYIGITSKTVEQRFLAHRGEIKGLRPLRKKHGKPLKILTEFTKEGFKNRYDANDAERLLWNKLRNDRNYFTTQTLAPKERGRKVYNDDFD